MAIDLAQWLKIRATRAVKNTPKGFAAFEQWVHHHAKERSLPIHYLMEATGVYYEYEQLALYLHQHQAHVCVVLLQKTANYIKALCIKSKNDKVDAQALATMAAQQRLESWQPITQAMYTLRQTTI